MLKKIIAKLWDRCRSDPWFVVKFIFVTLTLGAIGKAMLIGAVDGANIPKTAAQFVPTIPMMALNFLAHRYLWDHKTTSLRSHVGGHWSKSYAGQFIAGHSLFMLFAVTLGLKYWVVSMVIGVVSAIVTFALNELKIFVKRIEVETATATQS